MEMDTIPVYRFRELDTDEMVKAYRELYAQATRDRKLLDTFVSVAAAYPVNLEG